ncbi:MAG: alkaline phosphatase family protein, partial [Anaerolineae bacterium]
MVDLAHEIESLVSQRSTGAVWPADMAAEFIAPRYDGFSLVNVPATVAAVFGKTLPGVPPLDQRYWGALADGVHKVIVVLLDAFGYRQLQSILPLETYDIWKQLVHKGLLLPMTSVCPSTTTTALACLGTGAEPIAHGLLGYELWLRE